VLLAANLLKWRRFSECRGIAANLDVSNFARSRPQPWHNGQSASRARLGAYSTDFSFTACDIYLKPFVRDAATEDGLATTIAQAPGLDGGTELNEVLGKTNEPVLQARYEQQELKRTRK
jgi:hypothetical protein